jgi:cytochrome P450
MIDEIVEERRPTGHGAEDLLARLLADHDALDPAWRSAQFYDEAITLMLAGHETTANALTYRLHLLGWHRALVATLRADTRAVRGGRPADIDDLPRLVYTRMVLDEAMRLYPPAWVIDRNCTEADEVGGYVLPKGSLLLLSPYVTHRHPAFWEDAERFDPLRFEKA